MELRRPGSSAGALRAIAPTFRLLFRGGRQRQEQLAPVGMRLGGGDLAVQPGRLFS